MINFDFSFVQNIDLKNKDNLWFFIIIFLIFLFFLIITIILIAKLIIFIKNIIKKIFNIKKEENKSLASSGQQLKKNINSEFIVPNPNDNIPERHQVVGSTYSGDLPYTREQQETIKSDTKAKEIPHHDKLSGNLVDDTKKSFDSVQSSKIDKNILKNLDQLKGKNILEKNSIESIMPSRNNGSDMKDLPHKSNKDDDSLPKISIKKPDLLSKKQNKDKEENTEEKTLSVEKVFDKSIVNNKFNNGSSKKQNKNNQGGIMFGDQDEVSRKKLEYKLRKDPKIWQANRLAGLNLSPLERSKLVKEAFSSDLGLNISKKDLNITIRKLGKKLIDSQSNPHLHEKIRQEIKFFKKIGGIK